MLAKVPILIRDDAPSEYRNLLSEYNHAQLLRTGIYAAPQFSAKDTPGHQGTALPAPKKELSDKFVNELYDSASVVRHQHCHLSLLNPIASVRDCPSGRRHCGCLLASS